MRRPALRLRTLRGRLLAAFLTVVVAGLLAVNVLVAVGFNVFLRDRLDQQLGMMATVQRSSLAPDQMYPLEEARWADKAWALIVVDPHGKVRERAGGAAADFPKLSPASLRGAARGGGPVDVAGRYRAVVEEEQFIGYLITAHTLGESHTLTKRLLAVQTGVSLAVLAAVAFVTVYASRRVLRPLESMARTAGAIADGELSHRVETGQSPTEVARLESAFNTMLARIEEAFGRRRQAEEQLRRLVADVSHELRTPLTTITGYVQLFGLGALETCDERDDAVRRVTEDTRRMTALVDELLLLARLEEGHAISLETVDLEQICGDAVANARIIDQGRELRFVCEPGEPGGPAGHPMTGDSMRLTQVVTNLLANVRAHTPPGTEAELRLGRDGDHELIDVTDNGPGIQEQQRAQIFERFFRGDESRHRDAATAPGHGSGLGLSIVAAIVAAHGGSVRAMPAQQGAWFRIRLPGHRADGAS